MGWNGIKNGRCCLLGCDGCRDAGGMSWLDVDGTARVDPDGVCDCMCDGWRRRRWWLFWIILGMCRLRLLLLLLLLLLQSLRLCHGGDGLDASHVSARMARVVQAVAEGTALFVHDVPLGQAGHALEDVLPVEEAELHVAHAPAVGRSDGLVRVEVDDAGFLGVGPAQAEGEGVGGVRMIADDDLII